MQVIAEQMQPHKRGFQHQVPCCLICLSTHKVDFASTLRYPPGVRTVQTVSMCRGTCTKGLDGGRGIGSSASRCIPLLPDKGATTKYAWTAIEYSRCGSGAKTATKAPRNLLAEGDFNKTHCNMKPEPGTIIWVCLFLGTPFWLD